MNRGCQGRALENAIAKGFAHYRKLGRADGKKLATGMRKIRGRWRHAERSGTDFAGTLAPHGRGLFVEAKETARPSWPLSQIRDSEAEFLNNHQRLGACCLLVIDFTAFGETYAVSWEHVAAFMLHPWRESLSIDWCRAYGTLVPNVDGVCLFLDGVAHPEIDRALASVLGDKTRSRISSQKSFGIEMTPPPAPKATAKRTKEQIIADIRTAAEEGIRRVAKVSKR